MSYEFFISRRYMRAKRKQVFVSIITFISIFGIFLGVAALIIVLAVMNGFEEDLRSKILGIRSHIEVTADMSGPMKNYPAVRREIEQIPGVVASTPFIYTEAMIQSPNGVTGVVIRGMETQSAPGSSTWEKSARAASIISTGSPKPSVKNCPRPTGSCRAF